MEEREPEFAELPLSYLYWRAEEGGGWLYPESLDKVAGTRSSNGAGAHIEPQPGKGYWWPAAMPRQVMLVWGDGAHDALVPVIDQFGRVAGGKLADLDLDAASWVMRRTRRRTILNIPMVAGTQTAARAAVALASTQCAR
jgi:hypothetical protein